MNQQKIKIDLMQSGGTVLIQFTPIIQDKETIDNCEQSAKNLHLAIRQLLDSSNVVIPIRKNYN